MTIKFEFDSQGFKRDLKRQMEQAANDAMRESASQLQAASDSVLASHGGHPIEEVKPMLAEECQRHEFAFDDHDLTNYATAISQGTRILVKPEQVRL
jgi:hypothetical protein